MYIAHITSGCSQCSILLLLGSCLNLLCFPLNTLHTAFYQALHWKLFDTIPQGVCFAPLQAFIPRDLWCYLPQWFLHAALVDSYESERCLLDMFPGKYEHTFVKPSAGRPLPIEYRSCCASVPKIQQRVPAAIFARCWTGGL